MPATRPFTKVVAERIFCVSSSRLRTSSTATRVERRPPSAAAGRDAVDDGRDLARVLGADAEGVGQRVGAEEVEGLGRARLLAGEAPSPSR